MTSRITKHTVDKYKCSNLGGTILLIVVGKLYGRVLIQRVKAVLECATGQEQCGFRLGRGCVDQVFAVWQVCEMYLMDGKEVSFVFILWSWRKIVQTSAVFACR